MKMTCGEMRLRERVREKWGNTVTIGRVAMLTRNHNGRPACHYCGPCERGCVTNSYFSSPFTTVADALKTGRCKLITNAVVSHVDMDNGQNRARGVTCIDRVNHTAYQVRGRAVILCAQALESTRILLNSSNSEYPKGLANSSGALGHYLMDHAVGAGAGGEMPEFVTKIGASMAHRANGIYVIRFRNVKKGERHPRFIRGYGYQGGAGMNFRFAAEGFGASYKQAVLRGTYGVELGAFGESLARWDNYCEIDANLKDAWGIPALHINMTHGRNESAMMEDAAVAAAEMLEVSGAKNIRINTELQEPGMAIHELGTARMGDDPKKSVLNAWNQAHDVKNLFVMDGACFVSSACQNPTLTMMAITVRACDHLVEQFRKSEV
jgi:choline dehydrogenase-like flavoprotein